jgi:hypothetical protein
VTIRRIAGIRDFMFDTLFDSLRSVAPILAADTKSTGGRELYDEVKSYSWSAVDFALLVFCLWSAYCTWIPGEKQLAILNAYRACIRQLSPSGTLEPIDPSLVAFGNLTKLALQQLESAGLDKRRRALLEAELAALQSK